MKKLLSIIIGLVMLLTIYSCNNYNPIEKLKKNKIELLELEKIGDPLSLSYYKKERKLLDERKEIIQEIINIKDNSELSPEQIEIVEKFIEIKKEIKNNEKKLTDLLRSTVNANANAKDLIETEAYKQWQEKDERLRRDEELIIEKLIKTVKVELTTEQKKIYEQNEFLFESLYVAGIKLYRQKEYYEANEKFKSAVRLDIPNDSLYMYLNASKIYYFSEENKREKMGVISLMDVETITKLIKTVNTNNLIPDSEKESVIKELISYRENIYLELFKNPIKLKFANNVIPLYKKQFDETNKKLKELEAGDSLCQIFKNYRIKKIYNDAIKNNANALSNYLKYGEPNTDFIYINAACATYLKSSLNDPDYEIIKDKYYLKQTDKGYLYKMTIRGKNVYGAKILKEMTFDLRYYPDDKTYYCVKSW